MKKILVLSCGGTIVSPAGGKKYTAAVAREDAAQYMINEIENYEFYKPRLENKFGWVPKLYPGYITDTDSTNVGPAEWSKMIEAIHRSYDEFDAFLLPHGTNSLAYTASALSFALPNIGKPVVVTGSNVAMGVPWSDGPANASNSVLVLSRMCTTNKSGVFTVFANKIIGGVRTKKASGVKLEAFTTFNKEEDVGKCVKDEPQFNEVEYESFRPNKIESSPWFDRSLAKTGDELVDVQTDFGGTIDSRTFHPGDDPEIYRLIIAHLADRRAKTGVPGAMIIRAVGDGDVSTVIQREVFPFARENEVPIVVTTQEPQGVSSLSFNEQSMDAEGQYGIIPAHDMCIETMVIKLRYLMSTGNSYKEIHEKFTRNFLGEINVATAHDAL